MKKLIITGASGFLGWNIAQEQLEGWKFLGIYYKNKPTNINSISLNLSDRSALLTFLNKQRPDAVLHLGAISNVGRCESNPEETREINIEATVNLAKYCAKNDIPFVFTSSEQIFDGTQNSYSETDAPSPINNYGSQKAIAEKYINEIHPRACIARISVMFGRHDPNSYCFATDWLSKLKEGHEFNAFQDEIRTFMNGSYAAKALLFLLSNSLGGIFNIGGNEALSRYDFAQKLCKVNGLSRNLIIPASQKDFTFHAKRPPRLVLNCEKLINAGFYPQASIESEMKKIYK